MKNNVAFLWDVVYSNAKQEDCNIKEITRSNATVTQLENSGLRIRDTTHQEEFIVEQKPTPLNCSMNKPVHKILFGFSNVFIALDY